MVMIMTDKELLEYAAKAVGIRLLWSTTDGVSPRRDTSWDSWTPLTDDGDALRLAVNLEIWVHPDQTTVEVVGEKAVYEYAQPDPCAATRRAIVRAAAEIGKAMP